MKSRGVSDSDGRAQNGESNEAGSGGMAGYFAIDYIRRIGSSASRRPKKSEERKPVSSSEADKLLLTNKLKHQTDNQRSKAIKHTELGEKMPQTAALSDAKCADIWLGGHPCVAQT